MSANTKRDPNILVGMAGFLPRIIYTTVRVSATLIVSFPELVQWLILSRARERLGWESLKAKL